ncbi:MAG: hypothetical protein J5I93_23570 [Pirellulaceae bacterium]|nr:hypothetical protein [Pirellulaceae bacterium]
MAVIIPEISRGISHRDTGTGVGYESLTESPRDLSVPDLVESLPPFDNHDVIRYEQLRQAAWKIQLKNQLDRLLRLEANWDGFAGHPISREIIASAKTLISSLPRIPECAHVAPISSGRLQIEWHRGNRSIELEFESPNSICFLKCDDDDALSVEDTISASDVEAVTGLLDWFNNGVASCA